MTVTLYLCLLVLSVVCLSICVTHDVTLFHNNPTEQRKAEARVPRSKFSDGDWDEVSRERMKNFLCPTKNAYLILHVCPILQQKGNKDSAGTIRSEPVATPPPSVSGLVVNQALDGEFAIKWEKTQAYVFARQFGELISPKIALRNQYIPNSLPYHRNRPVAKSGSEILKMRSRASRILDCLDNPTEPTDKQHNDAISDIKKETRSKRAMAGATMPHTLGGDINSGRVEG